MTILNEGLKAGDLEGLVLPLISIDEYESKLDDDSVVIAFYVKDKDPANDLNRFIQKGSTTLLDTDVSPAPTEEGLFLVFVELLRGAETPRKVLDILESLEGLTGITDWKGTLYGQDGEIELNIKFLIDNLRMVSTESDPADSQDNETDSVEESVQNFFRVSDLDGLSAQGREITLEARNSALVLSYVDHGLIEDVYENNEVMNSATRIDESARHNCRRLENMLGDFWVVEQRNDHVLLTNPVGTVGLFRI